MTDPAPHPGRAEQTQPSGYTPPPVGAPTWSGAYGASISVRGDRLEIEWPSGRGMSWVVPKVIEGWVEQVNELRAERDRWRAECLDARRRMTELSEAVMDDRADRDQLRAVIAAAYVDLLAGRVDEATGTLRAAGGQP